MRSNNNWLYQPASSRRPFESGPKHMRQHTQIRFAAVGTSVRACCYRRALLPEGRRAYAAHISSSESYRRLVAGTAPRGLTSGSNRSLSSLGRAKARPLTKRYRNHSVFMYNVIKKYAPNLLISTAIVSALNYYSYQAIILIAQAQTDTIPAELTLEIIATISIHIIALSAVPLILSAKSRTLTSYAALATLSSIYITYMTGINVAGPAIAIVAFCYLAFYGGSKAKDIYNHYRIK